MGANLHRLATCAAAVCLAGLALLAGTASAAVTISPKRIVVATAEAKAVVERSPFRVSYSQPGGGKVLSEVPNRSPSPLTQPATNDPQPPGHPSPSTPTLYAPLGFLVGSETLQQYDGGLWGGNLLSGERSGIQYSARRVLSVKRAGPGVKMSVSTNDPSGRKLEVRVMPQRRAAIRLVADARPASGVAIIGDSFSSGKHEGFYGFGGRHNALDQHGQNLDSFVEEENVDGVTGFGAGGTDVSLYPNGASAAYYPQASMISSRPYGFLMRQPELTRFQLDSNRADAWNASVSSSQLDYVVAPGDARRSVRTLTSISGRQPVPPRWALGPMLDRLARNFGENESDYEAALAQDLRKIREFHLPLKAYRVEGWGVPNGENNGFSMPSYTDRATLLDELAKLKRMGIHPLAYLRPWVKPDSQAVARGDVATHDDGTPYMTSGSAGQQIAMLDFTSPGGRKIWRDEVRRVLNLGFDGFMEDFGEQILSGMHFADGETGKTVHNRYPTMNARETRETFNAYEHKHPDREPWFFTRAGYSGTPGSAAYEGGNFPGDETTDWTHTSGIASLTPDMLNRAVGGAYGYGTDIGGYFDYTTPPTDKELFLRWSEWAALSPVFRLHGTARSGTHTPWSYDGETIRVYKHLSRLHERAVPLIMRLWRNAEKTGVPPTRPLWLQFSSDPNAAGQDQEWMLGKNVLVAPVVTEGASSRQVYFPHGCWKATGANPKRYRGRRSAKVGAGLTQLPYFKRCGTHPFG